jgi:hypothetical protein
LNMGLQMDYQTADFGRGLHPTGVLLVLST